MYRISGLASGAKHYSDRHPIYLLMLPNAERTVAVVDDDEFMRRYLCETLSSGGFDCRSFPDSGAALRWLTSGEEHVDLLLSDINMPGMSGLDLLRTVKAVAPDLPFILISGICDLPLANGALRAGATDYLLKPVRPADLLGLVSRHTDSAHAEAFGALKKALQHSLGTVDALGDRASQLLPIFDVLGCRRFETLQHSRRVSAFTLLIGRGLGLGRQAMKCLEVGALLHDIGKVGIPHNVLMKPGKLNDEEFAIVRMHPRLGLDLLSGLPDLDREAEIVYSHHERFDGNGYPQRLAGESIPLSARVFFR